MHTQRKIYKENLSEFARHDSDPNMDPMEIMTEITGFRSASDRKQNKKEHFVAISARLTESYRPISLLPVETI